MHVYLKKFVQFHYGQKQGKNMVENCTDWLFIEKGSFTALQVLRVILAL